MTQSYNADLPNHAADKVKRALDDVLALTDDPGEKIRIAWMAASIPIGMAAGFLSGKAEREGIQIPQTAAFTEILELLRLTTTQSAEAVMGRLNGADAELTGSSK